MPLLVLFDIDGTLLVTGGAGSRAMKSAWRRMLGREVVWRGVVVGTPDPLLFEALATANGAATDEATHQVYKRFYLEELATELEHARAARQVRRLPGVDALLDQLSAPASRERGVIPGLLSGNYPEAARMKFSVAGVDASVFTVRSLADRRLDRNELAHRALATARELVGCDGDGSIRTVVIGDTPRDIEAARAIRGCSIAVTTGMYSREQLREYGADRVVADLQEIALEDLLTSKW